MDVGNSKVFSWDKNIKEAEENIWKRLGKHEGFSTDPFITIVGCEVYILHRRDSSNEL